MAGLDGLETLTRLRELDPGATVVMISGHGTISTAVQATQRGAFDFLEKPLDTDRLLVTVRNALDQSALAGENRRLRGAEDARHAMVGDSPSLKEVRALIDRVGPTPARVLITGENGTGKELVARAIHEASPRKRKAFVEVNCAAIPSELIESELFGHMKGSFTGAVTDREGKFELADEGTLFLDEIGDMALVGPGQGAAGAAGRDRHPDRRVQVDRGGRSGHRRDQQGSRRGNCRGPLPRRSVLSAQRGPHSRPTAGATRREDIPALVQHFAQQLAANGGVPGRRFEETAVQRLQTRQWPGNVRELRNAVERLLILAPGKTVTAADVSRLLGDTTVSEVVEAAGAPPDGTFEAFKHEAERSFLASKLREHDWNVSETARSLEMPRSNLYKKIERYGLSRETP